MCSLGSSVINPMCPGSRLCVRACQCPDQKSVLECFTILHVQFSNDLEDSSPESFLRGFTAILLGLLVKDDPPNQSIVMSMLPGISSSSRIKSLITCCHTFLDLYDDTMALPSSDAPHGTPEAALYEDSSCHRMAWDRKGKQIAQSVIASLELLCNT